jgi:hypothetical protein
MVEKFSLISRKEYSPDGKSVVSHLYFGIGGGFCGACYDMFTSVRESMKQAEIKLAEMPFHSSIKTEGNIEEGELEAFLILLRRACGRGAV